MSSQYNPDYNYYKLRKHMQTEDSVPQMVRSFSFWNQKYSFYNHEVLIVQTVGVTPTVYMYIYI